MGPVGRSGVSGPSLSSTASSRPTSSLPMDFRFDCVRHQTVLGGSQASVRIRGGGGRVARATSRLLCRARRGSPNARAAAGEARRR